MNTSAKFECRWVELDTQQSPCVFTKGIKPQLYLPVAHAEGRFTAPDNVLSELESTQSGSVSLQQWQTISCKYNRISVQSKRFRC